MRTVVNLAILCMASAVIAAGASADGGPPSISQVASQVANVEQQASADCRTSSDETTNTITVNCSASNNSIVVQQICQQVVERMNGGSITCSIQIDTNVPVPGPQGAVGAVGPQGPAGPPGVPGVTPMPVSLPEGMSCPAGSTGGFVIEFIDTGTMKPLLGPDGKPIYYQGGPICNGRDAVQCPNMGLMKFHTAHEISVMTGTIRVQTLNLQRQIVCVSLATAKYFTQQRLLIMQKIAQKVTVTSSHR